jgi:hypothetical protein
MHIPLPNGDHLVPDAEFLKAAGDVTPRTGNNWDKQGCPFILIKNMKYRPWNEGFAWLASRIKRLNRRRAERQSAGHAASSGVTLPRSASTKRSMHWSE